MNRLERLALLACLFVAGFSSASAQTASPKAAGAPGTDARAGDLDMVLLIDKSLSMASCMEEVKAYAAGKVLSPILVPGDRLIIEAVYGRTDRLVKTTIGSEEDKAAAIRAIRGLKANGRFTDLGAALDTAKKDLTELGQPERPKYVLLLTDERQEAPAGSPYQAKDYKLKHPSLEYVKRLDLGKFRAITVGLQVGAKVDAAAPTVMQLLADPPVRLLDGGAAGGAGASSAASGKAGAGAGAADGAGSTAAERALPAWLLYGAAAILLLALIVLVLVLVLSKRGKKEGEEAKTA